MSEVASAAGPFNVTGDAKAGEGPWYCRPELELWRCGGWCAGTGGEGATGGACVEYDGADDGTETRVEAGGRTGGWGGCDAGSGGSSAGVPVALGIGRRAVRLA